MRLTPLVKSAMSGIARQSSWLFRSFFLNVAQFCIDDNLAPSSALTYIVQMKTVDGKWNDVFANTFQ